MNVTLKALGAVLISLCLLGCEPKNSPVIKDSNQDLCRRVHSGYEHWYVRMMKNTPREQWADIRRKAQYDTALDIRNMPPELIVSEDLKKSIFKNHLRFYVNHLEAENEDQE